MSDLPIRPEAVEAAAKAAHDAECKELLVIEPSAQPVGWEEGKATGEYEEGWSREKAIEFQQAAIVAFCEAEGLTVEGETSVMPDPSRVARERLVGPWRDVAGR